MEKYATSVLSYRETGWCNTCDGIRDIEAKLDKNELQSQLQALIPQSGFGGMFKSAVDLALGRSGDMWSEERERLQGLLRVAVVTCIDFHLTQMRRDSLIKRRLFLLTWTGIDSIKLLITLRNSSCT